MMASAGESNPQKSPIRGSGQGISTRVVSPLAYSNSGARFRKPSSCGPTGLFLEMVSRDEKRD